MSFGPAHLFRGFPDSWLDVQQRHAQDSVVLEGMLGGTHLGEWMGIKPTGKTVELPFCFTDDGHLKTETVITTGSRCCHNSMSSTCQID
jgi:hypothetical protein